jgi:long-chain fatty acid transport protein
MLNILTLDTVQNVASIGLTFGFNECNELSAYYAHGFGDKVLGSKDSIPVPLGGGKVNLHSSFNACGVSYGRWF